MFKSILLCLGLAVSANALDTPTSSSVLDFSGGLNSMSAPIYLQPNESPDLMNVVIDEPLGALQQRKGYLLCGHIPSGLTATNLYEFIKSDGSHSLIVTDNISIWTTPDCTQWATIVTGLNQLFIPRFATINDRLWMVNGSTWTSTWDGTTFTRLDGSVSSRPLAPKGRYITNWKNRVWIAAPPTDPSSVAFNSLTDPLGTAIDPAISTNAWSSLNVIYFGKNDGSPIYGVYPYKDNLMVFKERSMWRLLWESEFNLQVVKSVSSIGSKFQDSIVEMDDGTLRYVGTDGIYGYNGNAPVRMSTKITPNFYAFKQPSRAEQSKIWDTATDWVQGNLNNSSTSYLVGSVSLPISSSTYLNNLGILDYGTYINNSNPTTKYYNYTSSYTATATNYRGVILQSTGFKTSSLGTGRLSCSFLVNTGYPSPTPYCTFQCAFDGVTTNGWGSNSFCSGVFSSSISIVANNGQYGITVVAFNNGNQVANIQLSTTTAFYSYKELMSAGVSYQGVVPILNGDYFHRDWFGDNGTYTTQITTATGISQWGVFDALSTPNGQTLTYDIRTATSVYNLGFKSYRSITPGAIVSTNTTEGFAQVRANFATADNGVTPLLDKLALNWITGDTSISTIKGITYKSRYWLVGSTQPANQYNDTTIVESKPPLGTYTLFNTPLSAMTLWNGTLYASISNTDKIVRMDYGTSDDGTAIASSWSSRDQVYDNPVKYKSINKAILDYVGTGTSLNIGLSPDSGGTWQDRTLTTTVGPRKTSVLYYDANMSGAFRTRISHTNLDSTYLIYGLHTIGSVSEYIGN